MKNECARAGGLLLLVACVHAAAAPAAETSLEIKVVKRIYDDKDPQPFKGVGLFDLFRGPAKLEGASCPEKSDADGILRCKLKCDGHGKEVINLRVHAPTNQDHLAGWVTPPAMEVKLQGCKLTPGAITASYEDARFALEDTVTRVAALSGPIVRGARSAADGPAWADILKEADRADAVRGISSAQRTEKGRSALFDIARFAGQGAAAYQGASEQFTEKQLNEKDALAQWEALSKNALLLHQFERVLPPAKRGDSKLSLSPDPAKYLDNLRQADEVLQRLPQKTPDQLKLADDIKTLRSVPAIGADARRSLQVMERWR